MTLCLYKQNGSDAIIMSIVHEHRYSCAISNAGHALTQKSINKLCISKKIQYINGERHRVQSRYLNQIYFLTMKKV